MVENTKAREEKMSFLAELIKKRELSSLVDVRFEQVDDSFLLELKKEYDSATEAYNKALLEIVNKILSHLG